MSINNKRSGLINCASKE